MLRQKRQPAENIIENTGGLAGPDHAYVEFIEYGGVSGKSLGERSPSFHILPDLSQRFPKTGVLGLRLQGGETLNEGDAGAHERGELPAEYDEVLRRDPRK